MPTFLLATRNRHKIGEIRGVLGLETGYLTLDDFPDAPVVVEDAPTFAGNARKKADELAAWLSAKRKRSQASDLWVLADDSGLEVDALGGQPGVHSARFAAHDSAGLGNSTDAENNAKLLRLLARVPPGQRTARFRCAIALAPDPASTAPPAMTRVFEGVCEGTLLLAPRGDQGFGYDPLFQPAGYAMTFAELGAETKNRISHRAQALARLRDWLASPGAGRTTTPPSPR